MTEENINQPATPPNDYQNHLIWRNIFVYIILPYQFIITLVGFIKYIKDFNEYSISYIFLVLSSATITLITIAIVVYSSITKKSFGYKWLKYYSIFFIIYKSIFTLIEFIFLGYMMQIDPNFVKQIISFKSLIVEIFSTLIYIAIAIINLIYFSHRKFLFGIYPGEPTTPESREEK